MMNVVPKVSEFFFITILLNRGTEYTATKLFENVLSFGRNSQVRIVFDMDDKLFYETLYVRFGEHKNIHFYPLKFERLNSKHPFTDNMAVSLNLLRSEFLQSIAPYFLIIYNNVFPPRNLLSKFARAISYLDNMDPAWGVLGRLYHRGWQTFDVDGLQKKHNVLSGCTVFKRSLLEKYRFEYMGEEAQGYSYELIDEAATLEYNFYNGHWTDSEKVGNPRTKSAIVRIYK